MPAIPLPIRRLLRRVNDDVNRMRLGAHPSWRRIDGRFEMEIDPADVMDRGFYAGDYSRPLVHLIRSWLRPGSVAIDVGAQKGYIAMQLASQVGPAGRVLAFEPDPRARAILERHRERNRFRQLETFAVALGGSSGAVSLHLSSRLGWSTSFPNSLAEPTVTGSIEVPLRTLDGMAQAAQLGDVSRIDFVKLDCEGAEVAVLEGMRGLLARARPLLWVEVNSGALAAAGASSARLHAALTESGLEVMLPRFDRWATGHTMRFEPVTALPTVEEVYDAVALAPGEATRTRLAAAGIERVAG